MILPTRYKMKPPPSAKPIKSILKKLGCVGLLVMNENGGLNVFDLSGNGNGGIISGATWQPEKFGSGLNFVAGTNKITVAHSSSLNLDGYTGSYTIIIWAKAGSQAGSYRLIEKMDVFGAYPISGQGGADTDLEMTIYDGTHAPNINFAGIWDGLWHQIVFQVHNVDDKLYGFVDGKLLYNAANTTTATTANTDSLFIGNNVGDSKDFVGDIDHILIYNHAGTPFTVSEIAQLYLEPFYMFGRKRTVVTVPALPPEVSALYMDLTSQIWTIKHSKGLFTKL